MIICEDDVVNDNIDDNDDNSHNDDNDNDKDDIDSTKFKDADVHLVERAVDKRTKVTIYTVHIAIVQ